MDDLCASLTEMGMNPKMRWLEMMLREGVNDPSTIFNAFLESDISQTSEPTDLSMSLTRRVHKLSSSVILQVDEVVDVSLRRNARFEQFDNPKQKTLKVCFSDGGVPLVGIILDEIMNFDVNQPGLKIRIAEGTPVHYGIIILKNENVEVLGGFSIERVVEKDEVSQTASSESFEASANAVMEFLPDFAADLDVTVDLEVLNQAPDPSPTKSPRKRKK